MSSQSLTLPFSLSYHVQITEWNPACNLDKIPTGTQWILFHFNPRYDTSSPLNAVHPSINPSACTTIHHQWSGLYLLGQAVVIRCSQSRPAAPRGWKPMLNQGAFIFHELLCNNIWAGDLCETIFFYKALAINSTPAPLDQNAKGIPVCFVDSQSDTGIFLSPPPLSLFLFANDVKIGNHFVFSVITNIWCAPSVRVVV